MLNKKACIKDTITGRTQNGFVSQRMDYVYIQSVYRILDLHRDINTFVYLFTFHCSQLIFSKKVLSWHGDLYQYVAVILSTSIDFTIKSIFALNKSIS